MKRKITALLAAILLTATGIQAQTVSWGTSSASDIYVGSSRNSDITFYFEVQSAPISNGKIKITLPNGFESFNTAGLVKQGGTVTLPTPGVSGNVLTFSGLNITQGGLVHYSIPRYSKSNPTSNIEESDISIKVCSADENTNYGNIDLHYYYKYAQLRILEPSALPANQDAGFTVQFGANNGSMTTPTAQNFQFRVESYEGASDSATLILTYPDNAVTFSNWKIDNQNIPLSQISGTATACTVKLRKADIKSGNGFSPGDVVNISVDVLKKTCGVKNFTIRSRWAANGTLQSVYDQTVNGSFVANSSSGIPALKIINLGSIYDQAGSIYCQNTDGNIMRFAVTNEGTGGADNLWFHILVDDYINAYIDVAGISVTKGAAGTPLYFDITPTRRWEPEYPVNPAYVDIPYRINLSIRQSQSLSPGSADTFYVSVPVITPSDFFKKTGSEAELPRALRIGLPYISLWDYQCTDLCRENTYHYANSTSLTLCGRVDLITIGSYTNNILLQSDEKATVSVPFTVGIFERGKMATNGGKAVYEFTLPLGLLLDASVAGDIKVYTNNAAKTQWPVSSFTSAPNATADSTVYTITLLNKPGNSYDRPGTSTSFIMELPVVNTCSVNENRTVKSELHLMLYPTGSTTGGSCRDVVYTNILRYPTFILQCVKNGITYTFDHRRLYTGLKNEDGDSKPDAPQIEANPEKINHDYMLVNDTMQYLFGGRIADANSYKTLYAVVFSDVNSSYLLLETAPKILKLNGNSGNIQATLKNTQGGGYASPSDIGSSFNERYAYVWEITKIDNSMFTSADSVTFAVNGIAAPTYLAVDANAKETHRIKSWFYATVNPLANLAAMLTPANRIGDEEYYFQYAYYRPCVWTGFGSVANSYTGIQTKAAAFSASFNVGMPVTNEYRNLITIDSIVIEVPEGYRVNNSMTLAGVSVPASSTHANLPHRKTFVFGTGFFDVNHDTPSKVAMQNGNFSYSTSIDIASTSFSDIGTVTGHIYIYSDGRTYTQANVPRFSRTSATVAYSNTTPLSLTYSDPGSLKISAGGTTIQEALTTAVSWPVSIESTGSGSSFSGWLYVQGAAVENASLHISGVDYPGTGADSRWIKLPEIPAGAHTATLTVSYAGALNCNDYKISVFPLYDRTKTAQNQWTPTDAGISMDDAGFAVARLDEVKSNFIYRNLDLTIQNVPSRITGSIRDLPATPADPASPAGGSYGQDAVAVAQPFPVEVIFSTEGYYASVVNTRAELTVPAGLEYVASSAYLEVGGSNYAVTGTDFLNELVKLNGNASQKTISLKLSETGITYFGSYGELPGDIVARLRFRLKPTCDIITSQPRISARFFGDRSCGGAAINGNGNITYYSSPLKLTGMATPLVVTIDNLSIGRTDFECNEKTTFTAGFRKMEGANLGISVNDSLLIAVPKALNLDPDEANPIVYDLPAGTGTPARTNQAATGIVNRTEGAYRLITVPLPVDYFESLKNNSAGVQSDFNTYTVKLRMMAPGDYFNGDMRVSLITSSSKGTDCESVSTEVYTKTLAVVTRAAHTAWNGTDNAWNSISNWSDGIPGKCSSVTIASAATAFPVLTDTLRIDSVHFSADTEIGGVPYLNYRKATADLKIESNQWHLLSAPLMGMFSGDYFIGSRLNPPIYMRKYQSQDYWTGEQKMKAKWTNAFGTTNVPLSPGSGYGVWVDKDPTQFVMLNFPKDSMSYAAYGWDGVTVLWMEQIPSGGRLSSYRFSFDDQFPQTNDKDHRTFDMPVENGDTDYPNLLIANPFMSHLDFQAFHAANSGKIQDKFYVWNGNSFSAVDEVSGYNTRYIAPQQSFVVLRNGAATFGSLHFTPAMSVANEGTTLKRATLERLSRLQLKVYRYGQLQSEAEIRYRRDASNGFDETEDAWTLFLEDLPETAVIYSKIDAAAASINTLGNISNDIPLGIRTSEPGELKFAIEGTETFDGEVYLVDAARNLEINPAETPEYVFQNTTGNIPDRFYIRVKEVSTYIYKGIATPDIRIYQENGTVHITSAFDDPLCSVEISNAQGQIIAKREGNGYNIIIPIPSGNQVVVVKAVSERGHAVKKIRI